MGDPICFYIRVSPCFPEVVQTMLHLITACCNLQHELQLQIYFALCCNLLYMYVHIDTPDEMFMMLSVYHYKPQYLLCHHSHITHIHILTPIQSSVFMIYKSNIRLTAHIFRFQVILPVI